MTRREIEAALRTELRAEELPASLAKLRDEELESLLDALRTTRERHSAALARATEEALTHVPALLRTPIRKILGL